MSKMSTLSRKGLMALSGFFLMFFLIQHFTINFLSVVNPNAFNKASYFMGYNGLVQYVLQPVLMFGVLFHFIMALVLEWKNYKSRSVRYYSKNKSGGSFLAKNMLITGFAIFLFLLLHLGDFWLHEMDVKYVHPIAEDPNRFYPELVEKFQNSGRVVVYVLAFIFLGMHTSHGFESAFQTVGINFPKFTPLIKGLALLYSIILPLGFAFIAIYHYLSH